MAHENDAAPAWASATPPGFIRTATTAATINAVDLGWKDKVGSIKTGKFADIIAVNGDPMADVGALTKVRFVMKGGKIMKAE